jgi:hypothetical protein
MASDERQLVDFTRAAHDAAVDAYNLGHRCGYRAGLAVARAAATAGDDELRRAVEKWAAGWRLITPDSVTWVSNRDEQIRLRVELLVAAGKMEFYETPQGGPHARWLDPAPADEPGVVTWDGDPLDAIAEAVRAPFDDDLKLRRIESVVRAARARRKEADRG